jgi:hypothetical protein
MTTNQNVKAANDVAYHTVRDLLMRDILNIETMYVEPRCQSIKQLLNRLRRAVRELECGPFPQVGQRRVVRG